MDPVEELDSRGFNRDFLVLLQPAVAVMDVEKQFQIRVKPVMDAPAFLKQNVLELTFLPELLLDQGSNSPEKVSTVQMVDQAVIYT